MVLLMAFENPFLHVYILLIFYLEIQLFGSINEIESLYKILNIPSFGQFLV